MQRVALFLLAGALLASSLSSSEPKILPLWPGAAPGSENWNYEEWERVGPQDEIKRIHNVTHPTLTLYLPDSSVATGTAIIVCPGGGFRYLAFNHEGTDVAEWLNSLGVAAFVLKYRVARTSETPEKDTPTREEIRNVIPSAVADGQQAIRIVRSHVADWGISKDRIGILGFSAGGYVATSVALHHDAESRPNFAAPIYPGTPEDVTPAPDGPPIFLVHAGDDKTVSAVDHSIRLYEAWKKAGIPAEIHVYSRGGHGFGMQKKGLPVDTWTDRFRDWLAVQGLLKPVK
jgi:acetyl esterase/lipase